MDGCRASGFFMCSGREVDGKKDDIFLPRRKDRKERKLDRINRMIRIILEEERKLPQTQRTQETAAEGRNDKNRGRRTRKRMIQEREHGFRACPAFL